MFKAVIFDFNGTLFDDSAIHIKIWEKLYDEITDHKSDYKEFSKDLLGAHNKTLIDKMYQSVGKTVTEEENDRLSERKEAMYREYSIDHDLCHLIKGADALMDEIKDRGLKINLCSASIKANIDFFFEEFHVDRWFDKDLVVYDDGSMHDKVIMYQKAATNSGVDIKDCLIFEDSDYGAECAIKAGAKVILIDRFKTKSLKDGIIQIVYDFDEVDRKSLFA